MVRVLKEIVGLKDVVGFESIIRDGFHKVTDILKLKHKRQKNRHTVESGRLINEPY